MSQLSIKESHMPCHLEMRGRESLENIFHAVTEKWASVERMAGNEVKTKHMFTKNFWNFPVVQWEALDILSREEAWSDLILEWKF